MLASLAVWKVQGVNPQDVLCEKAVRAVKCSSSGFRDTVRESVPERLPGSWGSPGGGGFSENGSDSEEEEDNFFPSHVLALVWVLFFL